jgi:methionyl-tRNA formyltransferase
VTIMKLDEGLDTGPILLQKETAIHADDTAVSLSPRLADLGGALMVQALQQAAAATMKPVSQDHSLATLAPLLTKQDGTIDFSQTASEIHNRLRGFQPWPGVRTEFRGRHLEITNARVQQYVSAPSSKILVEGHRLFFGCGAGTSLEVLELQPEGKKRMTVREFLSGYRPQNNEVVGTSADER